MIDTLLLILRLETTMRSHILTTVLLGFLVHSLPAAAEIDFGIDLNSRFYITAGYSLGGEDLEEFEFDDGDSDEVTTGDGFHIGAGGYLAFSPHFQLQSGFSYFLDQTSANNADMSVTRFTYELMPFFVYQKHRLGGGLIVHFAPEFEREINDETLTLEFETAAGFQVEYGYEINREYMFGLKLANINYTLEDASLNQLPAGEDDQFDAYYVGAFLYGFF